MVTLKTSDTLLDLYCGTGTIGLYLSDLVKETIGIEEIPQAISDAKENAKLNKIKNATFYCGKVKNILKEILDLHKIPANMKKITIKIFCDSKLPSIFVSDTLKIKRVMN